MRNLNQFTDDRNSICKDFISLTVGLQRISDLSLFSSVVSRSNTVYVEPSVTPSANVVTAFQNSSGNSKVSDFIDLVHQMRSLRNNWNGYGSERPNSLARGLAELILLATPKNRIPDRVAPSAQGGVGIFFYHKHKYADIECFNTGEILAASVTGDGEPEVWDIKLADIETNLKKIGDYLGD